MVLAHNVLEGSRTQDIEITADVTFDSMLLSSDTSDGLKTSGFYKPSPIQLHAIPLGKCGFDLFLEAKSGTGKTVVFTVIALESLDLEKGLQVIILTPTREIAAQISDVIKQIGSSYKDLCVEVVMGGLPVEEDIQKLKKKVHILVGSPGRTRHLIQSEHIVVKGVRMLVLDEADKLMDKCFLADINYIFTVLPKQKQVIMSSATYPDTLKTIMENYVQKVQHVCPDSTRILLGIKQLVTTVKSHINIVRQTQNKFGELLKILSNHEFKQCLIFCNYQARVEELCKMLIREKWPADQLHGQLGQIERLDALKTLQQYKCRILVSTDLAARGIDASNVDLVINFEPPFEWQTYLHRIGRTGRFGSYGIAITILSEGNELTKFKKNIRKLGQSLKINYLWSDNKFVCNDSEHTMGDILELPQSKTEMCKATKVKEMCKTTEVKETNITPQVEKTSKTTVKAEIKISGMDEPQQESKEIIETPKVERSDVVENQVENHNKEFIETLKYETLQVFDNKLVCNDSEHTMGDILELSQGKSEICKATKVKEMCKTTEVKEMNITPQVEKTSKTTVKAEIKISEMNEPQQESKEIIETSKEERSDVVENQVEDHNKEFIEPLKYETLEIDDNQSFSKLSVFETPEQLKIKSFNDLLASFKVYEPDNSEPIEIQDASFTSYFEPMSSTEIQPNILLELHTTTDNEVEVRVSNDYTTESNIIAKSSTSFSHKETQPSKNSSKVEMSSEFSNKRQSDINTSHSSHHTLKSVGLPTSFGSTKYSNSKRANESKAKKDSERISNKQKSFNINYSQPKNESPQTQSKVFSVGSSFKASPISYEDDGYNPHYSRSTNYVQSRSKAKPNTFNWNDTHTICNNNNNVDMTSDIYRNYTTWYKLLKTRMNQIHTFLYTNEVFKL